MEQAITVTLEIKELFFDRKHVEHAIGRARVRALSKMGAFVRQRAQTSMRRVRGPSRPGEPPHAHQGDLRRYILFGYDPQTDTVVVGPLGFRRSEAPHVLEFGGRTPSRRLKRDAVIRPRPYMGPALEQERENFVGLWRNSVVRG